MGLLRSAAKKVVVAAVVVAGKRVLSALAGRAWARLRRPPSAAAREVRETASRD